MKTIDNANVHRFGDQVAVYLQGETVYLTPKQARAIARKMTECARDIGRTGFTESSFRSWSIKP